MKTMKMVLTAAMIAMSSLLPASYSVEAQYGNAVCFSSDVTPEEVIRYLTDQGYTVTSEPTTDDNGDTFTCYTTKNGRNYLTKVSCNEFDIVGHTDEELP